MNTDMRFFVQFALLTIATSIAQARSITSSPRQTHCKLSRIEIDIPTYYLVNGNMSSEMVQDAYLLTLERNSDIVLESATTPRKVLSQQDVSSSQIPLRMKGGSIAGFDLHHSEEIALRNSHLHLQVGLRAPKLTRTPEL
jgi:hypothetical protein